ncbi:hypothetical protein BCV02_05045 [Vibrio breoganii]|uniref:lipopolysaccharide biosynthesis protein n=1 Tax=Vibrio breoganii TaxID=553239 RepID=UPI000C84A01F|nr:oligosaccharide flippase family protein [Vibrio breoganii]PMG05092.1 hypothetical protein BCV02_05045 [Vibrio breoganii]
MNQTLKNLVVNVFCFIVSISIGLYLAPYYVEHLGMKAYGYIPLAAIMAQYIAVLSSSISSTISRTLTIALKENDIRNSVSIFSSSVIVIFSFCLLQLSIFIYPILNIDELIKVPYGIRNDIKLFFVYVFANYLISLFSNVFRVSLFSENRLDLIQIAGLVQKVTQFILILFFFSTGRVNLEFVGLSMLVSTFVLLVIYVYYYKRLTPQLVFEYKSFSINKVRSMTKIGGWLIINQIGFLLFLKTDLLLIKYFLDSEAVSEYSLGNKFGELLRLGAGLFTGLITPMLMTKYAEKKINTMAEISKCYVKFLSTSLAIPIAFVVIFSKELVSLWLGKEYEYLNSIVVFTSLPLVLSLGVTPLFNINVAFGKVKGQALLSLAFGICGLLLSVVLFRFTMLGYYGVAMSFGFFLLLKNSVFIPIQSAKLLNKNTFYFISIHYATLFVFLLSCLSFYLIKLYAFQYYMPFAVVILIISCITLFIISSAFYKTEEKEVLHRIFLKGKN